MTAPKLDIYTAEDYWNLPEGRRAELVDGVLYDMAPPSRVHQEITFQIAHTLQNHIESHGGPCHVYPAPFAVSPRANDSAWVEPDVTVVCDPAKLTDRGCEGAPDMVVEVVFPSNPARDYLEKPALYAQTHVRECWIVDPRVRLTTVYRFGEGWDGPYVYGFDEPVPVGIFEGLSVTVDELVR